MKTFLQYCTEEGEGAPPSVGTNTDSVAGLKGDPPVFSRRKKNLSFANSQMLKRKPIDAGSRNSN